MNSELEKQVNLFLKKNLIYRARGVLVATISIAVFTALLYFSR